MKSLLPFLFRSAFTALLITSPQLSRAVTELTWDPGSTNTGTQVYTHPNNAAGQYDFHIATESSIQGGWRTALRVCTCSAMVQA